MPNARASMGVYFGDRSPYNYSSLLNTLILRPTNQVAELMAGIMSLEIVLVVKEGRDEKMSKVLLNADSEYLVKGATD